MVERDCRAKPRIRERSWRASTRKRRCLVHQQGPELTSRPVICGAGSITHSSHHQDLLIDTIGQALPLEILAAGSSIAQPFQSACMLARWITALLTTLPSKKDLTESSMAAIVDGERRRGRDAK